MLKYGDVIHFQYCGADITAMVVMQATKVWLMSDEGTALQINDTPNRVLVYGLTRDNYTFGEDRFHKPGTTATFDAIDDGRYQVIE